MVKMMFYFFISLFKYKGNIEKTWYNYFGGYTMFHELINQKCKEWYQSDDCKIKNVIDYIIKQDKMRDAQVEAIKLYLFFKIYCKNLPLSTLFNQGYFLKNIDIDSIPLSKQFRCFLYDNKSARQLYEIAISDSKYNALKREIEEKYEVLDFKKIFIDIFHNTDYANYIYSLPMGAGKTYLMSAFMYLDLYFALNEPYNKSFAHNFIILAPSGLKSSIIPSLKNIKNFDASRILPEPSATNIKNIIRYEILDEVKTDKKSNKIKNPNVQKISQYQPYNDMFGVVFLTNAEKVILDKIKVNNDQLYFDFDATDEESTLVYKIANELRDTIGKIPNKAIFIDEVHHAASEEIKLHQVVSKWTRNRNVCEVVGFSGTPYLDKKEKIKISDTLTIENEDISNTIYYYPLIKGIDNFLKKPKIVASSDNNSLNIIKEGLDEFFNKYKDVLYNGLTSKIVIYSGKIETLEEDVYPFVAEYVSNIGMDPNEVILKYHGGNKKYSLPSENELEFASLNTKLSKKRIILLVGIGKEGWDCSSLTGVILSQKGCCPKKMILQTTCRCLRQVEKGKKETALIYLNSDNEKELSNQLKKNQHITIKELETGSLKYSNQIERHNRMDKLNIPDIEYFRFNLRYDEEIKEEANTLKSLKRIISNDKIKEDIYIKEIDLDGNTIDSNINKVIYGDNISFKKWLLNISKESFGFVKLTDLKIYEKELKNIYNQITVDNKLNMTYNHHLINSMVRQAFYNKRKLTILKEEIPESTSILAIKEIPNIDCNNIELQYPDKFIVKEIIDKDNGINKKIDLNSLSKEELLKILTENNGSIPKTMQEESFECSLSDRTFHYIPYVFNQSEFEKRFLKQVLVANKFKISNLEIYYNGDHNISSFRIECFKIENKKVKKVGLYTPDFLILQRKDNKIIKVLIVETKGQGFKNQQEFIDRRNYVEKEFIPFNNKKLGYKKFDYLYIEDTMTEKEILSLINNKIYEFFKEEK